MDFGDGDVIWFDDDDDGDRIEGCTFRDIDEVDPGACKKTIFIPWIVIFICFDGSTTENLLHQFQLTCAFSHLIPVLFL